MERKSLGAEPASFPVSRSERIDFEYIELSERARELGIDGMNQQEIERMSELGYHYLDKGNTYNAMRAFSFLHDFIGLRRVADKLILERSSLFDLPRVLLLLEDYEGIRSLLNNQEYNRYAYEYIFDPLAEQLYTYIDNYLRENGTLVATGGINRGGIDLVAIRNLARRYDVAVPIARGGLNQGAMAHLFGMPTRIIDISAHKRKVARGKWINPVVDEEIRGKRVLFFDKDAVTGASVRKAMEMLSKFGPASIGIYFTHDAKSVDAPGYTITEGLPRNIDIFYPMAAPLENAGDGFIEAHEKLGTLYGRRRLIEKQFIEEIDRLRDQYPNLSIALRAFIGRTMNLFDSLNQFIPGVSEVREQILLVADTIFQRHQESLAHGLYNFSGVENNLINTLNTSNPLFGFESILIMARYGRQAIKLASDRGIENIHNPSVPLAAFNAAFDAVGDGFDIALIVGPEGFAYEPYFKDLGLQTMAINIPESGSNEERTMQTFDDLSKLRGKRVIIVEDDVQTGTTLNKILENFGENVPGDMGLYLGQPKGYQKVENIPPDFKKVYMADGGDDSSAAFVEHMKSKGLNFF